MSTTQLSESRGDRSYSINKYIKALTDIKAMATKQVPIKKSLFLIDNKLHRNLFTYLIEMKVIKEEVGYRTEGHIFTWIYKMADNETIANLANKLDSYVKQKGNEYKVLRNSPGYIPIKPRKAKKVLPKQEPAKSFSVIVRPNSEINVVTDIRKKETLPPKVEQEEPIADKKSENGIDSAYFEIRVEGQMTAEDILKLISQQLGQLSNNAYIRKARIKLYVNGERNTSN